MGNFDIWLKTPEVADLLSVSPQFIRKEIKNYKTRKVKSQRGKPGYEIALSSLPPEVLAKVKNREVIPDEFTEISDRQRDEAYRRLEILKGWERYAEERKSGTSKVIDEYIALLEDKGAVSRSSLYLWQKGYKEKGLAGLIPVKKEKTGISEKTFSPEAVEFISDLFLNQNKLSLRECWKKTRKMAASKGWKVGSYSTLKRYFRDIPAFVVEKRRAGNKRFLDTCVPAIERDTEELRPYELIWGDHHQFDVAVIHEGRVIFPWMTAWMDAKSWKVTGYVMVTKPNSDSIGMAFYDSAKRYGVPLRAVGTDRGKDYRAKVFTGSDRHKRPKKDDKKAFKVSLTPAIKGLFDSLGLDVIQAIPYNAQAKPVERFFGMLEAYLGKYMRGYRGKNTQERPEKLAGEIRTRNLMTFDEFKAVVRDWVEYEYNENYVIEEANATPNQLFYGAEWERRMVREEELMLFCTQYPLQKTVRRNGIWMFNRWYWCDKVQVKYFARKVLLRYHPDYPEKLFVFDSEDRYVGTAEPRQKGRYFDMTSEEWEKLNRLKKVIKEAEKEEYKKLVPNPMTAKEREALAVDREAAAQFVEPLDRLPSKLIDTRFTEIYLSEEIRAAQKAKDEEIAKEADKKLDMFFEKEPEPEKVDYKKLANKYLEMF